MDSNPCNKLNKCCSGTHLEDTTLCDQGTDQGHHETSRQELAEDCQLQGNAAVEIDVEAPLSSENQEIKEIEPSQELIELMHNIERRLRLAKTFEEKRSLYQEFKNAATFPEFIKVFFDEEDEEDDEDAMGEPENHDGQGNIERHAVQEIPHNELGSFDSHIIDQTQPPNNEMPLESFHSQMVVAVQPPNNGMQQLAMNERSINMAQDHPFMHLFFEHVNATLIHSTQCSGEQCPQAPCEWIKRDIAHHRTCPQKKSGCKKCAKLSSTCSWHALGCSNKSCEVPYCRSIHWKTAEMKRRTARLPKKVKVGRRWVRNPELPPHNLPFLCGGCSLDLFD